tara:strand:- start:1374 stop:2432 length:1059 start_codon:yes stop_codon:yes gene_type:complete
VKKYYKVVGIMSGTSLDGLDFVLVEFFKETKWCFKLISSSTYPYPQKIHEKLKYSSSLHINDIKSLDKFYTIYLSKQIKKFLKKNNKHKIDFISSHGHTALHQPSLGITYQVGNLPILAKLINKKVICDFRCKDVEMGGQGAPLVPVGELKLFHQLDTFVNLGGFANITLKNQKKIIAYDICPVNLILNLLANKVNKRFDNKGEMASRGKLIPELEKKLNDLKFFKLKPPKSLGFEWVKENILPIFKTFQNDSINDVLNTYTIFIAKEISYALSGRKEALVTGGGTFNSFLIQQIKNRTSCNLLIPEEKIINFKEAIIFAFLGLLRNQKKINCYASVTGAKKNHSSGNIFLP